MIGLRGDGTGVFADARPVNEWSETKNLLWKVPAPNYGNSSPIVVHGKVFVTSEPGWGSYCPTLACWDADTGKHLWVKDLDQFADLPEAERTEAQGLRKKYYEMMWEVNRLGFQLKQETDEKKKQDLIDKISAVSQGSQKGGMTFAGFPGRILETNELS